MLGKSGLFCNLRIDLNYLRWINCLFGVIENQSTTYRYCKHLFIPSSSLAIFESPSSIIKNSSWRWRLPKTRPTTGYATPQITQILTPKVSSRSIIKFASGIQHRHRLCKSNSPVENFHKFHQKYTTNRTRISIYQSEKTGKKEHRTYKSRPLNKTSLD